MIFIDRVTGKIVQPTDAQIDALSPSLQAGPRPRAAVVTTIQAWGARSNDADPGIIQLRSRNPDGRR